MANAHGGLSVVPYIPPTHAQSAVSTARPGDAQSHLSKGSTVGLQVMIYQPERSVDAMRLRLP